MQDKWEAAHDLARFRPRYPHEQVVRWAFRNLIPNLAVQGRVKVLDHGCGGGRHALFFASEGLDAHACDISGSGVNHLKALAKQKLLSVNAQQCRGSDLSAYESESFDAVLSFGVLYYMTLDEARLAVREIHRILRAGGQFFCVVRTDGDSRRKQAANVGPCAWRIGALAEGAPSDMEVGMDMLFFSREDVSELFVDFAEAQIDRMTLCTRDFVDDDWLVYAVKGGA